jgi:hypothetical protein
MAQAMECLPHKHEAQFKPQYQKKKKIYHKGIKKCFQQAMKQNTRKLYEKSCNVI